MESCQAEATVSSYGVCNNTRVHPFPWWDFLSGVGSLWFSIGCFAYSIYNFFPLVTVHAWRKCSKLNGEQAIYLGSLGGHTHFWHLLACKMRLTMKQYSMFSYKPPHYFQACTKNLPNMEGVVCKTTSSRPKVIDLEDDSNVNRVH